MNTDTAVLTPIVSDNRVDELINNQEDEESVAKSTRARRQRGRALQVSMPNEIDQYAILILAEMSGCSVAEMVRKILVPYINFSKEIIIEEGFYNKETKMFSEDPEDIVKKYALKGGTKEYILKMQNEKKETGLKFDFAKPSRLY